MIEKEIFDFYTNILNKLNIPFIHIPNRVFGKINTPEYLKYFPDLLFYYKGTVFLRELGIEGSHKERKKKQFEKMVSWRNQGANIAIITNLEAAKKDINTFLENRIK